jgi:3-oxoacyl-[acyl-carrier protein] reductase
MGLLDNKTAVVLGASSGIGWAIAERLAQEGAEQVVAARRADKLEKLADQIGAATPRALDIADHDAVGELAAWCIEQWGHIDIVVNSAGIAAFSPIRNLEPETMREVIDVDYLGALWAMKHFCSAMADHGGGSFVTVTSATAILVPIGLTPYSGAKAAINFVTKIAAREFGPANVRVNAIAPTFVPTAMNNYGGATPIDEARVDYSSDHFDSNPFAAESALKRITTVDDCANTTLFLASDLSSSITGQIIPVDNGNCLMRLP